MEKICLAASQGTILAHDQVDAVMDRYVDGLPGGLKKILLLPRMPRASIQAWAG
jgi:hypothetical protein